MEIAKPYNIEIKDIPSKFPVWNIKSIGRFKKHKDIKIKNLSPNDQLLKNLKIYRRKKDDTKKMKSLIPTYGLNNDKEPIIWRKRNPPGK